MGSTSHGSQLHRRCRRRRRGPERRSCPLLRRSAGDRPRPPQGARRRGHRDQLRAAPRRRLGRLLPRRGAPRRAATTRKIRLTSTTITAEITLTHGDDGEFSLSAVFNPVLGGVDQATAEELAHAVHQICPYSKATRDNIPVIINVGIAA
ncbi:osmotically inducible protein OsmC [Streptomyces mirabilis]|uniref:osmotically inducible protein OsmC n=1 Tax=Streptomyces mirabilis TaxID=68239 RepID=UPI0032496EA1